MPGQWAGSTRRQRLPANWPTLRRQRLEIDGHRCTWPLPDGSRCPAPATDVDHVTEMSDDHRLEALQSLCRVHHLRKTGGFAGRAQGEIRRRMAAARFRPQEAHPGLTRP